MCFHYFVAIACSLSCSDVVTYYVYLLNISLYNSSNFIPIALTPLWHRIL